MEMARRFIHTLLCALPALMSLPGPAWAQSKVGTTAANFLTIPVGPRATAMGGAFVAIADDATDLFWNPGGLSRLGRSECTASHAGWLAGTSLNWFGLAIRLDEANAVGVSVNQLDYGKEEITTPDYPNGTGESWDAQDIAISASYARSLTDRFSVGGSVRFVQERIWNESANAVALDVGLLFTTQFQDLRIGMNIANFGTEMQLSGKDLYQPVDIDPGRAGNNGTIVSSLGTKSWTLPLVFTVGLAMSPIRTDDLVLTVAADALYPNSQTPYINVGGELVWNNLLSLRVGDNSVFKQAAEQSLAGGIGLQWSFGTVSTKFDYCYSTFGVFGGISRYALTVAF